MGVRCGVISLLFTHLELIFTWSFTSFPKSFPPPYGISSFFDNELCLSLCPYKARKATMSMKKPVSEGLIHTAQYT